MLAVVAAVVGTAAYGVGAALRGAQWLWRTRFWRWDSQDDAPPPGDGRAWERVQRLVQGPYPPADRAPSRPDVASTRWWESWGPELTLALVLCGAAGAWLTRTTGLGMPGSLRWGVGAVALLSTVTVVALGLRAGWRGLFGAGVPVGDWVLFGGVGAVGDRATLVGWSADHRDNLAAVAGWAVVAVAVVLVVRVAGSPRVKTVRKEARGWVEVKERSTGSAGLATPAEIAWGDHDKLERKKAAWGLADMVVRQAGAFVLGIDGEWGSGKSSTMNMMCERLRRLAEGRSPADGYHPDQSWASAPSWTGPRLVVVRLNLWEHQHDENPAVALLQAARDTVPVAARREVNEDIKAIMSVALGAVAAKGVPFGPGSAEVSLKDWAAAVADRRTDRFAVQERQARLSDRFGEVIDTVLRVHAADKVVFVLDDLDRCLPKVALDLLEKVHLLFRKRRCVVVLGLDIRLLELTVAARYRELGADVPPGDPKPPDILAHEYVEKIVDFTYRLPTIASRRDLVVSLLEPHHWDSTQPKPSREKLSTPERDGVADLLADALDVAQASLRRTKLLVNEFILYHWLSCADEEPVPERRSVEAARPALAGRLRLLAGRLRFLAGRLRLRPRRSGHDPSTLVPGGEPAPGTPVTPPPPAAPDHEYVPLLMAAVTAIQVLDPDGYTTLTRHGRAGDKAITDWFGLEGDGDGLEDDGG